MSHSAIAPIVPRVSHNATTARATTAPRLKAAVIGAGMLGLDLAERLNASPVLSCELVASRHSSASALRRAAQLGCGVSTEGITAVVQAGVDVVFDASSADAHPAHWAALASADVLLVDLTPSSGGSMLTPTVNAVRAESDRHLSLVSCGGQAVLPVLDAVARNSTRVEDVEVVTTVASASVGPATRDNLDEYLAITTYAVERLTGATRAKVMATISPALPAPAFRAQITARAYGIRTRALGDAVESAAAAVRQYAPGYRVGALSVVDDLVRATVTVTARGRRLPSYAGNVEIINAAAVTLAERYARSREVGHRG
ncbi:MULTISPECIES: acetaldehyde dehydrogenase [Streptomyces]|uniref:Acetaldehyde dehydrogenase n=1 Tax=Streptomyces anulatus TaxID=1892 RepID=A0ABZ1ZBV4_STRAQ|nr:MULTISPECIES: acetaldehyde dehydrogenase [Streptomyces]